MFSSTIDWEIGNVQTNSKGIRSAPLTNYDGSPVLLQLTDVHSPWSLHLVLVLSAAQQQYVIISVVAVIRLWKRKIKHIDDYMCQYIETHAARLFKNKRVNYKPLLLTKEDDPSLIRCKIYISGSQACLFGHTNLLDEICPETCETAVLYREFTSQVFGLWALRPGFLSR